MDNRFLGGDRPTYGAPELVLIAISLRGLRFPNDQQRLQPGLFIVFFLRCFFCIAARVVYNERVRVLTISIYFYSSAGLNSNYQSFTPSRQVPLCTASVGAAIDLDQWAVANPSLRAAYVRSIRITLACLHIRFREPLVGGCWRLYGR